jgi:predicted dienelactone hydrolase
VRAHAPGPRAPYLSDSAALSPLARLLGLPTFIFGHLKYVRTNAVEGAPVSSAATSFPLLIFSHGRGGYRQHNTFLVEALVSHGYVVAAIDHPYVAAGVVFPDGRRAEFDPRMTDRGAVRRVVPYLAQDARFVLDQLTAVNRSDPRGLLTNRIDLTRIGMFGVSLGGATTAQSCLTDARLRACLAIDVFMPADVVRRGLTQPTLWISRSADTMRQEGWKALDIDETQTTMRAVFDHLPGEGYIVRIPGAFHPNFADTPYLAAPWLAQRLGLAGPADPWRVHAIVKTVTLAFFDRELRDSHRPVDPRASFPEVGFEARPLPQAH